MTRPGSEVARGQRLAEVWRASAPSNEEIERLRARLAVRPARRRRSRSKVLIVALVQGFMLGGATLATAAWLAGRTLPRFEHSTEQTGVQVEAKPAKVHQGGRTPRAAATVDGVEGEIPHAAFADIGETNAPAGFSAGVPGAATEATRGGATPSVAHGRATRGQDREATKVPSESGLMAAQEAATDETESALTPTDGPWGRVARALSAGDWQRADAALVELARASDPATRDAADLARAELWIAHGRGGAFRANVERLASAGYTPLIRKRAAKLLDRLP